MIGANEMKVTDITPAAHFCGIGMCSAVYKTDHETLLVVGKRRKPSECSADLDDRVGPDEGLVEIPIGIIRDLARDALD